MTDACHIAILCVLFSQHYGVGVISFILQIRKWTLLKFGRRAHSSMANDNVGAGILKCSPPNVKLPLNHDIAC